jgi:hypothetical protein
MIDFSNVNETELGNNLDELIEILTMLSKLHTSTRMTVLAQAYPELYERFAKVNELSSDIFN